MSEQMELPQAMTRLVEVDRADLTLTERTIAA